MPFVAPRESGCGPSLQMWPHTYLVAIGAIADMPDALTHTRKARMTLNVDWLREFGATQHVRRVASVRVLNHHTIHREFRDVVAKRYCRESVVTA